MIRRRHAATSIRLFARSRRRRLAVVGAAVVIVAAVAIACGFDGQGSLAPQVDGAGGNDGADGSIDGQATDDAPAATLLDSSFGIPISDEVEAGLDGSCPIGAFRCAATTTCLTRCLGCADAHLGCANTGSCVGTCASCPSTPFECWACATVSTTTLTKTTCEQTPATCNVNDVTYCDCKALGGCFGPMQVCVPGKKKTDPVQCRGCGDGMTDNRTCVGAGGTTACKASTGVCQ